MNALTFLPKRHNVFGKSERAASPVEKFFGGWGPQPRKLDSDPAAYMPERQSFCGSCLRFTVEGNFWDCQGPQSLTSNPALTACASERMKTQRFSYFAGFAARELMREAKPVKLEKVAVSHFFDSKKAALAGRPSCVWDIPTGRVLITHEPS